MTNTLSQSVDMPLRDGVGASCVQVPVGEWPTVLAFLCAQFPAVSEVTWLSRFARDLVLDVAAKPLAHDDVCKTGMRIYYYRELQQETLIPFQETILYSDEHILVADKPHFLPVVPSGRYVQQTLLVRLKRATGLAQLSPVHRIDKDTAGLVMFSTNPVTRNAYQALFRERAISKTYHAIAPWRGDLDYPLCYRSRLVEDEKFFRTSEVAGDANTESIIEVIEHGCELALYRLRPVTGRKHQLRVHMASLGMPIVNDVLYPDVQKTVAENFSHPLQLLAKSLGFVDPVTGEQRCFESPRNLSFGDR